MSIDHPTTALDRALAAEERANHRVCDLEDALAAARKKQRALAAENTKLRTQLMAVCILPAGMTDAQRKKLIGELRPEFEKVLA